MEENKEGISQIELISPMVRRLENDYTSGTSTISKYVHHSLYETVSRVSAYLNSKHISGDTDSQGRPKPFFNIVTASSNIWFKATDIDRRHIKLFAKNRKEWINSMFANILLQDWMKRENFGVFLNDWGRVMSRYNSAIVKFVKNDGGLNMSVLNWNKVIVDAVDIDASPVIETLELSEGQLRQRVKDNGYNADAVQDLIQTKAIRETTGKQKKDTKADFYKLYEVHGLLPLSLITEDEKDNDEFVWQMHIVSFVAGKVNGKTEYADFTLYKGREDGSPYMLTHLLKEDDRTLAIGPVEYLFDNQWMQNHAAKSVKDQLDIASKMFLQTADSQFVGRNVLTSLEHGDVLVHAPNSPLSQVPNASHDTVAWQNYAIAWRDVGREMVGISEAMLGAQPKAGTAWRLQETLLDENYSLFETFTENKGLAIEQMLRERILPYLFSKYDTNEEISTILEKYDLDKLDRAYIKAEALRRVNTQISDNLERLAMGEEAPMIGPDEKQQLIAQEQSGLQQQLQEFGNQRFVSPDKVSWKEQFKHVEWDIEIEITNEAHNMQEQMTTINTALKAVLMPGFEQNPKAQALVGYILELAGGMSPLQYNALPSAIAPPTGGGSTGAGNQVELQETQRNIKPNAKSRK